MKKSTAIIIAIVVIVVIIGGVAAYLATAPAPAPTPPAKPKETLYVAVVDDMSGPYAASGQECYRGVMLALEEYNYTVLGHPIKLIQRDTELKPAVGVRKMREVCDKYGPYLIMVHSGCSSAVQLAMTEVAKEKKVLFWTEGWDTRLTGESGHRYAFRWDAPNWARASSAVAAFLDKFPEVKTAYFITADYAWGYDMEEKCRMILDQRNVTVLGSTLTKLGETDYSPAISKALATKPDVIIVNLYGTDLMNCIRQLHAYGAKEVTKILSPGDGLTMLRGIGAEALEGVYVGNDWWWKIDTPFTKEFVPKFMDRFGAVPSYYAASHYITTLLTLKAVEKAGTWKPQKVIPILEGMEYEGPTGKEYVRAEDHQCIHIYYLLVGKSPEKMTHPDDYVDVVGGAKVYPDPAKDYKTSPIDRTKEPL